MVILKKSVEDWVGKGTVYHIRTATPDNGRTQHIFLKVNQLKKPQLDKLLKSKIPGQHDFSQYGEIVENYIGGILPAALRSRMKEQYGLDC